MRISIECGTDIVDVFRDCDVERSLARYADAVADVAIDRWPDARVGWRIDTRTGFGIRIDGLDEADTEWLRERADDLWTDHDKWVVDPRAEALAEHLEAEVTHEDGHRYRTSGGQTWLVVTESELVQLDGGHYGYRIG